MLPIAKLHYRRVSDTPKGNLIYIVRDAQLFLAIPIEHSGARGPFPAALVINDAAGDQRMPLVDVTCGDQYCVDTGLQAAAVWSPPLAAVPQDTELPLRPGYIVLTRNEPALSAFHAGGRGDITYWGIPSGKRVLPSGDPFVFITEWRLGATAADGSFVQLAAYPDDYGPVPRGAGEAQPEGSR
jgi:hypothetical protein